VRHVVEKISLSRLVVVLDLAFQFITGTNTNLAGIALTALVELPNSRTQELEADLVGLRLMSTACFDPEAVVKCVRYLGILVSSPLTYRRFWRSFDKQDKRQPPQFLSTHPGHKQRATVTRPLTVHSLSRY
jgi:predicted Zn-dependent protease